MAKYRDYGFECIKVDGHDIEDIAKAMNIPITGKPKFIFCETIKGKRVSFMENQFGWHGKVINSEYRGYSSNEGSSGHENFCAQRSH